MICPLWSPFQQLYCQYPCCNVCSQRLLKLLLSLQWLGRSLQCQDRVQDRVPCDKAIMPTYNFCCVWNFTQQVVTRQHGMEQQENRWVHPGNAGSSIDGSWKAAKKVNMHRCAQILIFINRCSVNFLQLQLQLQNVHYLTSQYFLWIASC